MHILFENYVLAICSTFVSFTLAEVNHKDKRTIIIKPHQKVIWRYIAINVSMTVKHLKPIEHLQSNYHRSLQRKYSSAESL